MLSGSANNIANLHGCIIESNVRIGIHIESNGTAINIDGCTIEGNGVTGIWASVVRSLNIHKNYFENNVAEGGIVVTDPTSFTIKADVVLAGYSYKTVLGSFPLRNISIKDNFHNGIGIDCMYYGFGIVGGEI